MTEYIETLPLANTPEVFGLHPNAEIGYYTNAAKEMWTHLVELQPQTGRQPPPAASVHSASVFSSVVYYRLYSILFLRQ